MTRISVESASEFDIDDRDLSDIASLQLFEVRDAGELEGCIGANCVFGVLKVPTTASREPMRVHLRTCRLRVELEGVEIDESSRVAYWANMTVAGGTVERTHRTGSESVKNQSAGAGADVGGVGAKLASSSTSSNTEGEVEVVKGVPVHLVEIGGSVTSPYWEFVPPPGESRLNRPYNYRLFDFKINDGTNSPSVYVRGCFELFPGDVEVSGLPPESRAVVKSLLRKLFGRKSGRDQVLSAEAIEGISRITSCELEITR